MMRHSEVRIDLDTTDTGNGGRIVVRAWDGDVPVEALAAVVAEAHEVAHERLNAAESVAANSLSRVVKQLGLFVDMGDAIADVGPVKFSMSSVEAIETIDPGPPLRLSRLASDDIGI